MLDGWLDPAPVVRDLRRFDGRPWRGEVDCVAAGFPCPPVSDAGIKLGAADPRWLWPDVVRIVRDARPALVFLENVRGIVGRELHTVAKDLAESGFDAEWDCFSASASGAPHRRVRWFCLAADPDRLELRDVREWVSGGWSGGVRAQGLAEPPDDGAKRHVADSVCVGRKARPVAANGARDVAVCDGEAARGPDADRCDRGERSDSDGGRREAVRLAQHASCAQALGMGGPEALRRSADNQAAGATGKVAPAAVLATGEAT